jgi:hypothetical protein
LTVATALLIAGCQSDGRTQFEARRAQLQSPEQRRAAIQHCIKGVTPKNAWHRQAPPGAVKWCTDFVKDYATGRYTYDDYRNGPNIAYDYRRDRIVKLPAP